MAGYNDWGCKVTPRKILTVEPHITSQIHHFDQAASFWKFVKIPSYCSYEHFEPRFRFSTQILV